MRKALALAAILLLAASSAKADYLFGKNTVGTSNTTYTATNSYGSMYSCSVNGTVYYLEIYCSATGNDLKLGLYSGDGATKLAETDSFTAQAGWNKVALISPYSVSSGNSYAICVIGSATVTNQLKRGLSGTGVYNAGTVTWPNLLTTVALLGSNDFSIYAEDNLVSSPTNTPTISPTRTASPTMTATPSPTASPIVTPIPTYIPWQPVRELDAALAGQPQAVCAYNGKIWITINETPGKVLEIDPVTLEISTRSVSGQTGPCLRAYTEPSDTCGLDAQEEALSRGSTCPLTRPALRSCSTDLRT